MLSEKHIREMLVREIAVMKTLSKSYSRAACVTTDACIDKIRILAKILEIPEDELNEMFKLEW